MHAILTEQFGTPDVLRWTERDTPTPAPDQVAIRVSLTNVNFADALMRRGANPAIKLPFIPGLDCTGTIVSVGANVKERKVGERVTAFTDGGSYAEVALAREVLTYPIPDGVSDEAVCGMVVLVTAWNLLALAGRLTAGETVLVHSAAGGVGSTAIQIARTLGAKTIVGTVSDPAKVALARDCGADVVVDSNDFVTGTKAAVGDAGVDVILDAVTGDAFQRNFDVLAPFGRVVVYGQAAGSPGVARTDQLHGINRSVIGYSSGHYRGARPAALRPAADGSLQAIAAGKLKLMVGASFPLKDAADAHRADRIAQEPGQDFAAAITGLPARFTATGSDSRRWSRPARRRRDRARCDRQCPRGSAADPNNYRRGR